MSNLKCPKCGLVNFAGSEACKRCQSSLSNAQSSASSSHTFATSQGNLRVRSTIQTPAVQPSFVSIVKNDYIALLAFATPLLFWGLCIANNVFGFSFSRRGTGMPPEAFLYLAIGGTVLGIALLAWRFHSFQQVFANGENTFGRITSVSFFKDRGRIEYSYSLKGQTYQSGNAIMKNEKTQSFREGDEVELVVDRSNPKRAFIKTLYATNNTIRL